MHVSPAWNVARLPVLTNGDGERAAAATQNALEKAVDAEEATRRVVDGGGVAARDDLAIAAECVAISANSWLPSRLGHSGHGEGEDSENGWELHFDGC